MIKYEIISDGDFNDMMKSAKGFFSVGLVCGPVAKINTIEVRYIRQIDALYLLNVKA